MTQGDAFESAIHSGLEGFSSAWSKVTGGYVYAAHFRNGHMETVSEREMELMEAAYMQATRHERARQDSLRTAAGDSA